MARHGLLGFLLASVLLVATSARGGEPTLAEAIRAAAAAVKPAVVSLEIQGRPWAGGQPGLQFLVPVPGQGKEGERQFEFHWPPGVEPPQDFIIPKVEPFPGFPGFPGFAPQANEGSGLIVDVQGDRGLVAAPESLVANAQNIKVGLADGRRLSAKVLGTDKLTGLACLEVRGPNLAAAKAGKTADLQVGDFVAAVGGPATGNVVTFGIVGAKDRPGAGELAGARLIQTDALVTEAMAGGPLVNLKGEVVGTTFPSLSRPTRGRDLTSVLPIETVAATIGLLAHEGKIARGYLGIQLGPLTPEVQQQLNLDHGIQVVTVLANSPAARAGIQNGDVLLEWGVQRIADANAFRAQVAATRPGTRVPVRLLRGGQPMTVEVTVGEQPGDPAPVAPQPVAPEGGDKLPIGLAVQPLTPALANQFGFRDERGLLVTQVDPQGPAAKARPNAIQQGDLLEEIARKPVASLADAQRVLKEVRDAKARTTLLLIRTKETTQYVVIDLPE